MKVYKFGGASVRNADGVQNLLKIIGDERDLFIIVSAMGKTTNALEKGFRRVAEGRQSHSRWSTVTALRQYHAEIVNERTALRPGSRRSNGFSGSSNRWRPKTVYSSGRRRAVVRHRRRFRRADLDDDHFGVPLRTGYRQLLARYATLLPHRTATQGRLGRYRRIADSAAQRHETV